MRKSIKIQKNFFQKSTCKNIKIGKINCEKNQKKTEMSAYLNNNRILRVLKSK